MDDERVPPDTDREREEYWRTFLTHGDPYERRVRRLFRLIPAAPRCQLCAAPFAGAGAPFMRALGKNPSTKNPNVCVSCFNAMARFHGGAEIECTLLFADIRDSTGLAETLTAREFHAILDRFYRVASRIVFDHDGSVDKFVGDELVAMYFPLFAGEQHVRLAVESAIALLEATGHKSAGGPWVPVGAAVHTGLAWVGAVGDDDYTELTALGDAVNTTARLASAAGAGEVLVSLAAATAVGLGPDLEHRTLSLKGKQAPTEVVVLRPSDDAVAH